METKKFVSFLQNPVSRVLCLIMQSFCLYSKPIPPAEDAYTDDDVENEKARILNMTSDEISVQNLVLDRVTKYYDSFLAVNQISLCVKP